jgi:hypothetical protein
MRRRLAGAVMAVLLLAWTSAAPAIDVRATIRKVDAEGGTVVFSAGGQERTARVAADARVVDREGKDLAGGLRSGALTDGAVVTLTVEPEGGRPLIRAIRLGADGAAAKAKGATFPPFDTSGLKPLIDMGQGDVYHQFPGGLYPGPSNRRPEAHERAGLALAGTIRPLDADGKPADDGKIVLMSVGFSNTVQCFSGFMQVAEGDEAINPRVVLVNAAQGARSAVMLQDPDDRAVGEQYWRGWVPDHLKARGVTAAQVQVVWLKETDAGLPPEMQKALGIKEYTSPILQGFPTGARTLQSELKKIVQVIHRLFPNVKLVYVSSRSFGGWTKGGGNREPWSYETGYAVKWLIEEQIAGDPALNFDPSRGEVKAPWLSWGPYLWANGEVPRSDGFSSRKTDYREDDQMHHSQAGMTKMGRLLLDFFKADATTKGWFVKPSG